MYKLITISMIFVCVHGLHNFIYVASGELKSFSNCILYFFPKGAFDGVYVIAGLNLL